MEEEEQVILILPQSVTEEELASKGGERSSLMDLCGLNFPWKIPESELLLCSSSLQCSARMPESSSSNQGELELVVYSILTVGSRGTLLLTVLLLPGLISSPLSPPPSLPSPPLPPSTPLSSLTRGPEGGVAARPTSRVSKNSKLVLVSGSSPSRLSSFFFCRCFKYLMETDLMRFLIEL